jgi:hypothetical protein
MIGPFIRKCSTYHDLKRGWIKTLIACGMLSSPSTPHRQPPVSLVVRRSVVPLALVQVSFPAGGRCTGEHRLDILEEIRRKCIKEEGFTTRAAMDRVLVLRRIEARVRTHARHLVSLIREEQLLMIP